MSEMSGDIWCGNVGNAAKNESDAGIVGDLQLFGSGFVEIYEYDGSIVKVGKN